MRDLRKNRVLFQASNSIFGPVFWIGRKLPGVANRKRKASYMPPKKHEEEHRKHFFRVPVFIRVAKNVVPFGKDLIVGTRYAHL
jgi:hypothetical protein